MIKLSEVTQKDLDDVDARLELAMQRLSETALEVKAERDKYAAVLSRLRRECQNLLDEHRPMTPVAAKLISKIVEVINEVLD